MGPCTAVHIVRSEPWWTGVEDSAQRSSTVLPFSRAGVAGKCHLNDDGVTGQPQLLPGCLWLLEPAGALDALVLLCVQVLGNVFFPLSSCLCFPLPWYFSLPIQSTYQFCSQTLPSQCCPLHAQLMLVCQDALPQVFSRWGDVIPLYQRLTTHLCLFKVFSPAGNRPFKNAFMLVLKCVDSRTPYIM